MHTPHPFDLVIGLDRSDRKADLHLIHTASGQRQSTIIDTSPEARLGGNKFKANTVIAIKLARAVYFMLKSKTVFDAERLISTLSRN